MAFGTGVATRAGRVPPRRQMMHALLGVAEPPTAAGDVEAEINAKVTHTQTLELHNWLAVAQRFSVSLDFHSVTAGGTASLDESVAVHGSNTIDVPPHATRRYRFTVHSFREGRLRGIVRFESDATKEFVWYNVGFTVTRPETVRQFRLRTPARQRLSEEVFVENPLDKEVLLDVAVSGQQGWAPEITCPEKLRVDAKSTGKLPFDYFPLLCAIAAEYAARGVRRAVSEPQFSIGEQLHRAACRERQARLVLKCTELGEFPYSLHLTALPPQPEKQVRFSAPFGQATRLVVKVTNYCK
eukprot:gene716-1734_t